MSGRRLSDDVAEEIRAALGTAGRPFDPDAKLPPVELWEKAVGMSGLASGTRHVLLALSGWMNVGGSCFPSIAALVEGTGRSERSVQMHLRAARLDGWILVDQSRGRVANRYHAAVPADFPQGLTPQPRNPARTDPATPQKQTSNPANTTPQPLPSLHPKCSEVEELSDHEVNAHARAEILLHAYEALEGLVDDDVERWLESFPAEEQPLAFGVGLGSHLAIADDISFEDWPRWMVDEVARIGLAFAVYEGAGAKIAKALRGESYSDIPPPPGESDLDIEVDPDADLQWQQQDDGAERLEAVP